MIALGTWRYVLVPVKKGTSTPSGGHEIFSSKAYFTREACSVDARLVAQKMTVESKVEYGYRCVEITFEPPDLDGDADKGEGQ